MFEIDRKRKTIWAIAPNGAKIDCGRVSRYLNAHLCEARYYTVIRHETTEDGVLFTRVPDPGSEESKTPEAAFEALIKYLGLTEHEQPNENEEMLHLKNFIKDSNQIIHDAVVVKQAAWIEWKHGRGAEAAMRWIQNALVGPGFIPDEDEPYGKEAQAYYDANTAYKLPTCYCGRPSNQLWMGQGFCSKEHYEARRARTETQENSNE